MLIFSKLNNKKTNQKIHMGSSFAGRGGGGQGERDKGEIKTSVTVLC